MRRCVEGQVVLDQREYADWLLHSTFKEQIDTALSILLAEKIGHIPNAIMQGMECGWVGEKMDFITKNGYFLLQKSGYALQALLRSSS